MVWLKAKYHCVFNATMIHPCLDIFQQELHAGSNIKFIELRIGQIFKETSFNHLIALLISTFESQMNLSLICYFFSMHRHTANRVTIETRCRPERGVFGRICSSLHCGILGTFGHRQASSSTRVSWRSGFLWGGTSNVCDCSIVGISTTHVWSGSVMLKVPEEVCMKTCTFIALTE